jgi:hypothetical protein
VLNGWVICPDYACTVVKNGVWRVFYFKITVSSRYLKEKIAESKNLQVWVFGKNNENQRPASSAHLKKNSK